jgi:hypothetical protein
MENRRRFPIVLGAGFGCAIGCDRNVHYRQHEVAHACALSAHGQLHWWGRNHFRQLGRGHVSERELPAAVDGSRGTNG